MVVHNTLSKTQVSNIHVYILWGVGMEIKERKNPENFEIVHPVCV